MNQAQIRAVKDALEPQFKKAIGELETRQKRAVDEAIGEEAKKIFVRYAKHRSSLIDHLSSVQEIVKAAENVGISLEVSNGIYLERMERFQGADVREELTDAKEEELKAKYGATFEKKIADVRALQARTYLSLHSDKNVDLVKLVAEVGDQIKELL